jgi:hypothetical protein
VVSSRSRAEAVQAAIDGTSGTNGRISSRPPEIVTHEDSGIATGTLPSRVGERLTLR